MLIAVLFASLALTKLTYATECMDGAVTICDGNFCGGGGGGPDPCNSNPAACDGGTHKITDCDNCGCQAPAPVCNDMNSCPVGGSCDCNGIKCGWEPDGFHYYPDDGPGSTLVPQPTRNSGNWEDSNPNDSCVPSGSPTCNACNCTAGTKTCNNGCGTYIVPCNCCPAAVLPAKPTNPNPSNGTSFPSGGLTVDFSVDPPVTWGTPPNCNSPYHTLRLYGSSDPDKVINLNSTATIPSWLNSPPPGGGEPSATFAGVSIAAYGTTYYWRVMACNFGSTCTPSDVWSFTTGPLPAWWQSQMGDVYGSSVDAGIPPTCVDPTCSPFLSLN